MPKDNETWKEGKDRWKREQTSIIKALGKVRMFFDDVPKKELQRYFTFEAKLSQRIKANQDLEDRLMGATLYAGEEIMKRPDLMADPAGQAVLQTCEKIKAQLEKEKYQ